MFRFRMVVAGGVEMDRGLARFTDGISDWRPIWPVFSDSFYAWIRGQFESEGAAAGGGKWWKLSEAYAAWKERHFPGKPILQRTGALMASLTSSKAAGAVYIAAPRSLTIGSDIPYAVFHQVGAGHLPQRKEIAFSEAGKRELMKIAQMYLVEIATKVGFRQGLAPTDQARLSSIRAKYGRWPDGGS